MSDSVGITSAVTSSVTRTAHTPSTRNIEGGTTVTRGSNSKLPKDSSQATSRVTRKANPALTVSVSTDNTTNSAGNTNNSTDTDATTNANSTTTDTNTTDNATGTNTDVTV